MARPIRSFGAAVGVEAPPTPAFEGSRDVPEDLFLDVLDASTAALDASAVPYAILGGIASSALGRYRWTHDVDVFVRVEDADLALAALAAVGFSIQRTNPHWLYKALRDEVLVDILFRAQGDLTYDADMIARTRRVEFKGRRVRVLAPEDLLVIKAVVHDEQTPRHWYDALGLIKAQEMDWEYLVQRARVSPRRVLSLLLYAQSEDHLVPDHAVRDLLAVIEGGRENGNEPKRGAP